MQELPPPAIKLSAFRFTGELLVDTFMEAGVVRGSLRSLAFIDRLLFGALFSKGPAAKFPMLFSYMNKLATCSKFEAAIPKGIASQQSRSDCR